MNTNLYAPTQLDEPVTNRLGTRPPAASTMMLNAAGIGTVSGFAGYVGIGIAIENFFIPPRVSGATYMSYGRQIGVMAILAGALGAAWGASIGLTMLRWWTQ